MTDVLLAHSYFLKRDPKQVVKMQPYPPLATLYAASILRAAGYSVALFDAMLSDGEEEFEAALIRHRPRYVVLYEDSFNFLIKMCLGRMRSAALCMAAMARERGVVVIAAGPDVSDHPDIYFAHGVEYGLLGEADLTLRELLDTLDEKQETPVSQIAGLAFPDCNAPHGVRRTAARSPERQLDTLPFPAWDLVDFERYRAAWKAAHGFFSLNMVTTRGCPFHCNWCAKPIWGQRYAIRSPANVAEEMATLKQRAQPDHIWFADDIFGLRPKWVPEFAQEVRARNAVTPFTIQSRVDLMTEKAVEGLALAGCKEVWLGAESGSQKILDAMDKGTQLPQIFLARERLKHVGVHACFFIQFGYPGETLDDIHKTVQMVRDALPDKIGVSVSYPLPGTKFYDMVRAQLGPKRNWTDSDDLAMMFQGAYQSPFYRHLHKTLHHDLEVRQRLYASPDHPTLFAELDRLNADWLELGRLEVQHRNESPTHIEKGATPPPPDLSEAWN